MQLRVLLALFLLRPYLVATTIALASAVKVVALSPLKGLKFVVIVTLLGLCCHNLATARVLLGRNWPVADVILIDPHIQQGFPLVVLVALLLRASGELEVATFVLMIALGRWIAYWVVY